MTVLTVEIQLFKWLSAHHTLCNTSTVLSPQYYPMQRLEHKLTTIRFNPIQLNANICLLAHQVLSSAEAGDAEKRLNKFGYWEQV